MYFLPNACGSYSMFRKLSPDALIYHFLILKGSDRMPTIEPRHVCPKRAKTWPTQISLHMMMP